MLHLFKSRAASRARAKAASGSPRAPARIADDLRLYAIGDIHGRRDLLVRLVGEIAADHAGRAAARPRVVFLGDYIDRGPESRAVLELLAGDVLPGFDQIFLLGNHEDSLLSFVEDIAIGPSWLGYGGAETLRSYGIDAAPYMDDPAELRALQSALRAALPARHEAFLQRLELHHTAGDYLFVHAGIRPGVPLERQSREDLIWIRDAFLRSPVDHGCIVVHGHSIRSSADRQPNRIGIDTGAYHSGVLTCLALQGAESWLIQT